jgi:hypothetical protein
MEHAFVELADQRSEASAAGQGEEQVAPFTA